MFATIVAGGVLLAPAAALGHVSINPNEAEGGGSARVAVRVPNESDTASTISVEINMPEDYPLGNVRVQPTAGWEHAVERRTLDEPVTVFGNEVTEVISKITFTGGSIGPSEFQEFELSLGPLPEEPVTLMFPSIQTYDDGEIVRWIEETPEGGEEPEHPAPTLTVTAAAEEAEDDHGAGSTETTVAEEDETPEPDTEATAATSEAEADDDDDASNGLAIVALIVGIVGVLVGGAALLRGRR